MNKENVVSILYKGIEVYIWISIIYLAFIKYDFSVNDLRNLLGFIFIYVIHDIYKLKKEINKPVSLEKDITVDFKPTTFPPLSKNLSKNDKNTGS